MKKALLPIAACLGATTVVLTTGRVANPDSAEVIPYPEVINLKRVPTFDEKGIIPQQIAKNVSPPKIAVNLPSQQYPHKKLGELLVEHQNLREIRLAGASPKSRFYSVSLLPRQK